MTYEGDFNDGYTPMEHQIMTQRHQVQRYNVLQRLDLENPTLRKDISQIADVIYKAGEDLRQGMWCTATWFGFKESDPAASATMYLEEEPDFVS
jgi:hypothetical protein